MSMTKLDELYEELDKVLMSNDEDKDKKLEKLRDKIKEERENEEASSSEEKL